MSGGRAEFAQQTQAYAIKATSLSGEARAR